MKATKARWLPTTEAEERVRLIRVARSDANWWRIQETELLVQFPVLQRFAKEQADRFDEIAHALESAGSSR